MSSGDPETHRRILEETRRLMEERHGRGVRVEDIAAAAGVSRQAVYLHFGSRSGLLVATARYLDDVLGLNQRLQPFWGARTGIERLEQFVDFWASYIPDIYGLAKTLMSVRETDKAAKAAWDDRMGAVYQGCQMVVKHLADDGLLEWPPKEAADFMFATLSIPTWENLTMERGWSRQQYLAYVKLALKSTLTRERTYHEDH